MKKFAVVLLIVGCMLSIGFAKDKGIVITKAKPYTVIRNINPNNYSEKYWQVIEDPANFPDGDGIYMVKMFDLWVKVDAEKRTEIDAALAAKEVARILKYNEMEFSVVVSQWQWTQDDQYIKDEVISQETKDNFLLWIKEGIQKSRLTTTVDWNEFIGRRPAY